MSGVALTFAEADLAATAAAYNPALHEAPLVIGHPQLDGPAYGWVTGLQFADGALEATPRKVDPAFAEAVARGSYGKISAAFFTPSAPGNPVPGVYYLRHVGFLGATPPAVKGLRDPAGAIAHPAAAFSEPEPGVVTFAEWDDVDNASLWRGLRDWLLGKFGQAEADAALPGYLVQSVERGAQDELRAAQDDPTQATTTAPAATAFAQTLEPTVSPAEKTALEAENTRLRLQLATAVSAARLARQDTAQQDAAAFADALIADSLLPLAARDVVIELLASVALRAETEGAAVQFGQADARAPLLPAVKVLLRKLAPLVAGGQHATAARAAGDAGGVEFAAPEGAQVNQDSLAVHRRVSAYRAAHPGTSYRAAMDAVLAGAL